MLKFFGAEPLSSQQVEYVFRLTEIPEYRCYYILVQLIRKGYVRNNGNRTVQITRKGAAYLNHMTDKNKKVRSMFAYRNSQGKLEVPRYDRIHLPPEPVH